MEKPVDNVENLVEKIIPVDNVEKCNLLCTGYPEAENGFTKKGGFGFAPYQQPLLRLLLFFIYKNKIIIKEEVDKYGD